MIKKWKTISSRIVFEHPRMKLSEDVVELPNGERTTYLREQPAVHHSVGVIARDEQGRILLQREYSYPPDEILYQLPGGGIEAGEDIIEAGMRELSEESGLTATNGQILGSFFLSNRHSNKKQYIVLCSNVTARELPADPEEFIESMWMEPAQIEQLVRDGIIQNINLLAALQLLAAKGAAMDRNIDNKSQQA